MNSNVRYAQHTILYIVRSRRRVLQFSGRRPKVQWIRLNSLSALCLIFEILRGQMPRVSESLHADRGVEKGGFLFRSLVDTLTQIQGVAY